ncbi:hypothetical protein LV457_01540 [Mycobacterium sp. MYCO198283]|uniref:rhomboid-like protein n=1 Tax=Mycobacterium sp. MYCO198283 TaxID=2883505 RepID=UPI001E362523|nr:rhomboid-like protein [Mycobacterium sp. MYCO198283]MCG5430980.1 hypothetical protein [Mycobacterium sp. MYCO198283]
MATAARPPEIRTAWLTDTWLALLFVTTRVQRSAPRRRRQQLLREQSTNLAALQRKPLRVMLTSLLWLDGRRWWPYVPVFVGVLAPVERLLGPLRFVAVGMSAHVGGTLISQALLARSIRRADEPRRLVHARDVGVSYFVLGIFGMLAGTLDRPGRNAAQLAAAGAVAAAAATRANFTTTGHNAALLIGTLWSPLLARVISRRRGSESPLGANSRPRRW